MKAAFRAFAASGVLVAALAGADTALAQKQGGILRVYHRDSPASMSIHEEGTVGVIMPMMGVFNNLVIFDQHVPQNSMQSIVPELATGWAWSEDGTELTFKLRDGVKWHDGKPFTAEDVKCTLDLLTNPELSGMCQTSEMHPAVRALGASSLGTMIASSMNTAY